MYLRDRKKKAGFYGRFGNEEGLTLVELVVALIVIGILAGIAVPVFLDSRHKADRATAVHNLRLAGSIMDRLWFNSLEKGSSPDGVDSYRDFNPPAGLMGSGEYASAGYVPFDGLYMSLHETRIKWVDLEVGGTSPPVASVDISGLRLATGGYGFRITGVYQDGKGLDLGEDFAEDWSILPGKICVVGNKYYWDGGWQDNSERFYVTLITLERRGIAHYLTMRQGAIADYGLFEWNNGTGNPGEGWKEEEEPRVLADADDPPEGDVPPEGPVLPPAPPADPPPNGPPTTGGDDPPAVPPAVPPEFAVTSMKIEPEVLNLKSAGDFSIFIEMRFAPGYSVANIDPASIRCFGASPVNFNIAADNKMVIKFNRRDLRDVPTGEAVVFSVTGRFFSGVEFEGFDIVRVTHGS